jgi:hypothetical protein
MKYFKYMLCLFLLLVMIISHHACAQPIKLNESFQANQAKFYVYYAHPEGGIRAYLKASAEVSQITDGYDFHPNFLPEGYVYFLRYQKQKDSSKNPPPVKVMKWNASQNRSSEIGTLSSISPVPDIKNQCFFVDNGEKLLILNHNQGPQLINIGLDQKISSFNMSFYARKINPYSAKHGAFLWLVQYPYQNVFKNKADLIISSARSAIMSINQNYTLNIWDEIPGDDIFQESYHGLCFDEINDQLFLSKNAKLYSMNSHESSKKFIEDGVHPFIYHEKSSLSPLVDFAWLQVNSLILDDSCNIFTTSSHISYISLEEKKFHILDSSDMELLSKNYEDDQHLFDRLIFIGQHRLFPSKYLLVSMARTDQDDPLANIRRDQLDVALIFSLEEGRYKRYWSASSQHYGEIWIQDLNNDGTIEILNQYCASSFTCPEDIRLNGRSLVWINIYRQSENLFFERANEVYPEIYRELWERLNLIQQEVSKQKRLGEKYFCEDDLVLFDQLIEESYRLATPDAIN